MSFLTGCLGGLEVNIQIGFLDNIATSFFRGSGSSIDAFCRPTFWKNTVPDLYFIFPKKMTSRCLHAKKKFIQDRICVYKEENGYKFSCLSRQKDSCQWVLSVDNNFFRFEYRLSPDTVENSSWYDLTFNRFFLQHTFINHHGLIIHAAGGYIHGKGMVFPAVSGTGKSTLSHLLLPFPENQLYSEERIIMRKMNDGWHLWGTPWKGTGVIARNESAPLSALVFLSQAPQTTISELPPSVALRRLLETVSIPWYSQEWIDKGLAVCESLLRDVPAFELSFRPDQTAVQAVADLAASLP